MFYIHRDTVAFTVGRLPEACSEAPSLIWTDRAHRRYRRRIPPLFNWNVEGLWCTEHYLVFSPVADYEYGQHDERIGFWHLKDGRVVLSSGLIRGWREAHIAESNGALVFATEDSVLALWPERRSYSVGPRSKRARGR